MNNKKYAIKLINNKTMNNKTNEDYCKNLYLIQNNM